MPLRCQEATHTGPYQGSQTSFWPNALACSGLQGLLKVADWKLTETLEPEAKWVIMECHHLDLEADNHSARIRLGEDKWRVYLLQQIACEETISEIALRCEGNFYGGRWTSNFSCCRLVLWPCVVLWANFMAARYFLKWKWVAALSAGGLPLIKWQIGWLVKHIRLTTSLMLDRKINREQFSALDLAAAHKRPIKKRPIKMHSQLMWKPSGWVWRPPTKNNFRHQPCLRQGRVAT